MEYSAPVDRDNVAEPMPPAPPEAAAAAQAEPPRRRSTIREPVTNFISHSATAPAAADTSAPVITSTTGDDTAQPKRGWWARRILGDKD
jgi:hypothetical protein